MKKIIITSLLMISFLTACQTKNKQTIYKKELKTNESITKIDKSKSSEEPIEESTQIIEENESVSEPTSKIADNNPITIVESSVEAETDTVDESSMDYPIHKGRIDCETESNCMDKSIPLQFKYKNLITNVFYIEVISKNENVLGYFIQYNFKENKYSTKEECETIGSNIKEDLIDKITNYECLEDNILKINTNY